MSEVFWQLLLTHVLNVHSMTNGGDVGILQPPAPSTANPEEMRFPDCRHGDLVSQAICGFTGLQDCIF